MKFTQVLYKIHIGKAIRYLWQHQRERPVIYHPVHKVLASMGITVEDALKVVKPPPKHTPYVIEIDTIPNTVKNWEDKKCVVFEDHNVLQEGISQACLLTNTLQMDDQLPQKVKELITDIPADVNNFVKRIVCTSTIYDPEQVKLPIIKDPERPAWVFPRRYGISSTRKMHNLSKKFLQLCESLNGLNIAQYRSIVHNGLCCVGIDRERDLIQFSLKMDLMMTSTIPLSPVADVNTHPELHMPDLYPLHHCIGLRKSNICKYEMFPINIKSPIVANIHTIFINYDPEEVKNLTELPVTEDQIYARSLIKSFTAAAGFARQKFGTEVKELPEPVVVQCVQSDGQKFHFSVYQLNTLDLDNENIRNFWWSEPFIKLYELADYEDARPCLRGYNNAVFKRFLAFYQNK